MEHDTVIGEKMFLSAWETRIEFTRTLKGRSFSLRERDVLAINGCSSANKRLAKL